MNWWRRALRSRQMEEELDKELTFHLDEHTANLIAQGHAPDAGDQRDTRLPEGHGHPAAPGSIFRRA